MAPKRTGHLQRNVGVALRAGSSRLARYLKFEFCIGEYGATEVQKIALLSVNDHGNNSPAELVALSRLGTSGQYQSSIHEELMRLIERELGDGIDPLHFDLLMKTLKRNLEGENTIDMFPTGMISPHDWFAWLFRRFPDEFSRRFFGQSGQIGNANNILREF